MAEFKLNYTGSEINARLAKVDRIDLKADLVNGKVPLSQLPDDIGGGLTELFWKDIKDKPFYEEIVCIELPSDTSNSTVISSQPVAGVGGLSFTFAKVAEAYSSPEETYGASVHMSVPAIGAEVDFIVGAEHIASLGNGFGIICTGNGIFPAAMNIPSAGTAIFPTTAYYGEDLVFEVSEPGLYFTAVNGMAQTTSYENDVSKTLDIKFLPKNMALGYEETSKAFEDIIWDGNVEGLTSVNAEFSGMSFNYCKVSDQILTLDDVSSASFTYPGILVGGSGDITSEVTINGQSANGSFAVGVLTCFCIATPNDTVPIPDMGFSITLPETGVWFLSAPVMGEGAYTKSLTCEPVVVLKQFDEKFIPDTIARKSDLDGVSVDLSNYYTKNDVYNKNEVYNTWQIDDKLRNLNVDLSEYYTKTEVDDKISNVSVDLSGYYTKDEVYTKSEVYTKTETDAKLNNYCTKTQIDEIIGDIDTILDEISVLIEG